MRRRAVCWIAVLLLSDATRSPAQSAPTAARAPVAGTYSSLSLFTEIPTNFLQPPEAMLGLGRLLALGPDGRWQLRADLVAGLVSGRYLLDGALVGSQVTTALVLPGEYLEFSRRTFGEVYPIVGGAAYQYALWRSESPQTLPRGLSLAPSILAGAGVRVYERGVARPTILTVDFAYERRLRYPASRLLIRISGHRPARRAE